MFLLCTSEDVIAETLSKLRDNNPRWDGGQITRIRAAIVEVFDELVDDFDGSVAYQGADPDDFHVHAAALAAQAQILLTCDHGLLNQPNADELEYEAYHPDDFFVLVNDSAPLNVREASLAQLRYYANKNGERNSGLVDALIAAGSPHFAECVRLHLVDLAGAMPRVQRRKLRRFERLNLAASSRLGA